MPPTAVGIASGSIPARLRTRVGVVMATHTMVDVYAAILPPLLGMLEVRCGLTAPQAALLLGMGPIASGLSQPAAAWLSDRVDSRRFGALGLALAAVCLSCLGDATSFASLMALYVLGMIGVGMFHPIGASSAGQLAGRRRSLGLALFFVFGMAGGVTGSMLAPRIAVQPGGFELLRFAMVPGLILAALLQVAIGGVSHKADDHAEIAFGRSEIRRRWRLVGVLYVANALRVTVNIGLFYLFVRWAQALFARANPTWTGQQIADAAATTNGNLIAAAMLGMAAGGLVAGSLIRAGREKWPLVLTPLLAAPAVAAFPFAGVVVAYPLSFLAGVGYASMVPISMSLAQRLLPHRTSLASGMMLGGAWAVAILGPLIAERCIEIDGIGLTGAFAVMASLLALSGLACLVLPAALPGDQPARTMAEP